MIITNDLRGNTHVSNVCTKANRTLGFLRRNLHSCPQEVKEAAYKGLVRPVLEYGSSVRDPPGAVFQEELESLQKRAARFVTGNYKIELRHDKTDNMAVRPAKTQISLGILV